MAFAFLLVSTLGWVRPASAQGPVFKHYTTQDGLPGSTVYMALQDGEGYLWFATNNGLSRFDGYEFTNFSLKEGLTQLLIWGIAEDEAGRIWLSTFNDLLYVQGDSAVHLQPEGFPSQGNHLIHHFMQEGRHLVYLQGRKQLYELEMSEAGDHFKLLPSPEPDALEQLFSRHEDEHPLLNGMPG